MSFFERKPCSFSHFDKIESIAEQHDPSRLLKVALKHSRCDGKFHFSGHHKTSDTSKSNKHGPTSNAMTHGDKYRNSSDGIVLKNKNEKFCSDTKIFRVYCKCDECLQYREDLIQLLLEEHEYNTLWNRLNILIREFYDIVPQSPVPYEGSMDAKYQKLFNTRWFSDGHIDKQKSIQLSLSAQLPLSNEMTFMLVFSTLYTRDPHQLFELLCMQLRCLSIAYSDGLKSLITPDEDDEFTYHPMKLITFILDGYDKFCNTAEKLTSLLYELQHGHMQRFLLTWTLLNKRMYQRYVYMKIQNLIPECILRLKDSLEKEDYNTMALRLIRFDEDMTSIMNWWTDAWALLQKYHKETEEIERRNRIVNIRELLRAIRECEFDCSSYEKLLRSENPSKMQWMKIENRNGAWMLCLDYLKRIWNPQDDPRLVTCIRIERCATCENELPNHEADCDCVTCSLSGGPRIQNEERTTQCKECTFFGKLDRRFMDYLKEDIKRRLRNPSDESQRKTSDRDSEKGKEQGVSINKDNGSEKEKLRVEKNEESPSENKDEDRNEDKEPNPEAKAISENMLANHSYHLSWAVFKHLPSRQSYTASEFDRQHFCCYQNHPCMKNECRVATQVIVGLYPMNFSKLLIRSYQPLDEGVRNELLNIQNLYFMYLVQKCDDKLKGVALLEEFDIYLNCDEPEFTLLCRIGSAFAESYLIDMEIPVQDLLDSCFIVDNQDIELNVYWLECIYMLQETDDSPLKSLENDPKVIEFRLQMEKDSMRGIEDVREYLATDELKPETFDEVKALLNIVKSESRFETKECSESKPKIEPKTIDIVTESAVVDANSESTTIQEPIAIRPTSNECLSPTCVSECKNGENCDDEEIEIDNAAQAALTSRLRNTVKQRLNEKLEAELKSLKKEHSVLEDMVRDLEQIKGHDEAPVSSKNGKKNAAGGAHHCCADHSDLVENHMNHQKMCHRSDGQCTCYYCTIFGHSECNHGRHNETRDRLRKRLHTKNTTKGHSTKSNKAPPFLVKKMLAKKSTDVSVNVNVAVNDTNHDLKKLSKPVPEQRDNRANEMLEAASSDLSQKVTLKAKPVKEPAKPVKETAKPESVISVKKQNSDEPTAISYDVDNVVDFIEGIRQNMNIPSKKDAEKKAAKKAKQKQKKEDVRRVEELEQLRDQFHEAFFREIETKNELKTSRTAKKRDKKKISELETSIKKYGKFKSKIESNILELIGVLKTNNPEFKFAYLPTKEDLEKQQHSQSESDDPPIIAVNAMQTETKHDKSDNVRILQSAQRQEYQQDCEISLDQSKRMVTIRRINMPHAEPQVTVTAKGTSPDKDKLLYTFINGQLIPSANIIANIPGAVSMPSSGFASNQSNFANEKTTKEKPMETNSKSKNVKKTIEATPAMDKGTTKKIGKEKSVDKAKTSEKNQKTPVENSCPNANKKKQVVSTIKTMKSKNVPEENKPQKKKGKKDIESEVDSITVSTNEMSLNAVKKKKTKTIKFEYADPNYKVNQFDLLDDGDDDDYYIESSSEEESDSEHIVPFVSATSVSKQQTPSVPVRPEPPSVATQQSQNNKTKASKTSKAVNKKGKENDTKAQPIKSDKKTPAVSAPAKAPPAKPVPIAKPATPDNTSNLTKKQLKKLAQQQLKQQQKLVAPQTQADPTKSKSNTGKSAASAVCVNSLNNSMQKMQLNSDTTIEPVNIYHGLNKNSLNYSIMDQLNRGVKVEGLTLPPGITLTRVDPNSAEGLRAKKESISRISQPAPTQYQQPMEYQRPPPFMNPMPYPSNGLIMVDPMKNVATKEESPNSKKNRKNRKKKKNKEEENANNQSKIITLRNPLFQNMHDVGRVQPQPLQQHNQIPLTINEPASIIKNENGMFTIRNMALHQALSNGVNRSYRPYPNEMYQAQDPKVDNYSYFMGNASSAPRSAGHNVDDVRRASSQSTPASHHAIGSEMKNSQHIKPSAWYPSVSQQQNYSMNGNMFNNMPMNHHLDPNRSYSPFDTGANLVFNNDLINSTQNDPVQPSNTLSSHYFNSNGGFPFDSQTKSDNGSLFRNNAHGTPSSMTDSSHCCDDSPPMQEQFGSKVSDDNALFNKFEDEAFLYGLQSGQRLNSEVTIHNVNDPKFIREPGPAKMRDGVVITRINGPVNDNTESDLIIGKLRTNPERDVLNTSGGSEFGENVFVPNAAVNLNELESEERDIETFKRFNYYFEPPKNKPKINFDVKGIVLARKHPSSESSSPQFGEQLGSSLGNKQRLGYDSSIHSNTFQTKNCDPLKPQPTLNRAHSDNFLHGVIGDGLKTDKN